MEVLLGWSPHEAHVTDVPASEGFSMLWKAPGSLLLLLEGPILQGVLGGCPPSW